MLSQSIPLIYHTDNHGKALYAFFIDVLSTKAVFYNNVTPETGKAHIEKIQEASANLFKEAEKLEEISKQLDPKRFKQSQKLCGELVEITKTIAGVVEAIVPLVERSLENVDCQEFSKHLMGVQWLYLQKLCLELCHTSESLKEIDTKEAKRFLRKRALHESFHMTLRTKRPMMKSE